jgi:uncharacterized membrane protein YhaH (DUF805 family)
MEWYLKVVRDNFANFKGRARRKEFWMFVLFNLILSIVVMIADNIIGTTFKVGSGYYSSVSMPYGWLFLLYSLAVLIPAIAVSVRRLHDLGKSGGWIFISLIPFIGAIWLLVLFVTEGEPNANTYGASPKSVI